MNEFGWASTTDDVLAGKDLSGRTVFITGANSGLGQETARAMAAHGAEVILAGRDQAKLDESVAAIKADHPKALLETLTVDLTSLENIRAATSRDTGFQWKTIPQGAATSCWAATAPELEGKGGVYCEDCHVAEVDDESATGGVRSYAVNSSYADRLWAMSEELTGVRYPS